MKSRRYRGYIVDCSDSIRLQREPAHPAQTPAARFARRPPQPRDHKGRFAQAANDQARQSGLALRMGEGGATNIRCDRCGREPDEVAPMLKDAIWRQIARKNETLCKACAHEEIRRRFGRELRFADLLPCAFNITWCSAFEELMPWDEPLPPGELERWQRAFGTAERLIGNRKAMEEA